MENIFKRFRVVGETIVKNLDAKSLARSKEASREISEFLENEKIFLISIIKSYKSNFKGFEDSWNEVIHKTPVKIMKQLAIAVQIFFKKFPINKEMAPFFIAEDNQNIELCKFIITKVTVVDFFSVSV